MKVDDEASCRRPVAVPNRDRKIGRLT